MRPYLGVIISHNLSALGEVLDQSLYLQKKRLNLLAVLILVSLIALNWAMTKENTPTHIFQASIAIIASVKFLLIYLIFLDMIRAHIFWIASGVIYAIAVAGLMAL